jgi:DNA-binding CsgD family transcriptional regulator
MTIWQRILRVLGYAPPSHLAFHADEELLQSLQTIAESEQRHTGEVASELLSSALAQRQVNDKLVAHWRFLSAREQQVAALTCLNFTNRQIAARLMVTPETAKTHVRNVLRKFDLHSKAELRRALADWDFSAWLQ